MLVLDLVNRVKDRTHRGNRLITTDAITQQIIDAINDSRREIIRLIPKQWLRSTYVFNTIPATLYGGATSGTTVSAASPATSLSAIPEMAVSINGEPFQTITLLAPYSTGVQIALSIQNAVQRLTALYSYNQAAYIAFTATYTSSLYTLTSGSIGTTSSVVITSVTGSGITDAGLNLKLTAAASAVATAGTGAAGTNPVSAPLYDMPADCQEPILMRYNYNGADYFLSKLESEREFYLNVFGTTVVPNKPLFFFDAGVNQATACRQMYIWPIADIAYTILLTYMSDPTLVDLTTANLNQAVPVFPSYVQDALWKGARFHFLENFDDAMLSQAEKEYKESMEAIEEADERDLDSDLQFRMDIGRRITDFRAPGTGIRLK